MKITIELSYEEIIEAIKKTMQKEGYVVSASSDAIVLSGTTPRGINATIQVQKPKKIYDNDDEQ